MLFQSENPHTKEPRLQLPKKGHALVRSRGQSREKAVSSILFLQWHPFGTKRRKSCIRFCLSSAVDLLGQTQHGPFFRQVRHKGRGDEAHLKVRLKSLLVNIPMRSFRSTSNPTHGRLPCRARRSELSVASASHDSNEPMHNLHSSNERTPTRGVEALRARILVLHLLLVLLL